MDRKRLHIRNRQLEQLRNRNLHRSSLHFGHVDRTVRHDRSSIPKERS
jgi:hypothetical protein